MTVKIKFSGLQSVIRTLSKVPDKYHPEAVRRLQEAAAQPRLFAPATEPAPAPAPKPQPSLFD